MRALVAEVPGSLSAGVLGFLVAGVLGFGGPGTNVTFLGAFVDANVAVIDFGLGWEFMSRSFCTLAVVGGSGSLRGLPLFLWAGSTGLSESSESEDAELLEDLR